MVIAIIFVIYSDNGESDGDEGVVTVADGAGLGVDVEMGVLVGGNVSDATITGVSVGVTITLVGARDGVSVGPVVAVTIRVGDGV